jgi:hypothetical protein
MNIAIPVIPVICYATGFALHTAATMNRNGKQEVETYKKKLDVGMDQLHKSPFEAYWSGCKTALSYGIVDSIIWPIKSIAFFYFKIMRPD